MGKINQLGKNQLKSGNVYSFEVVPNKDLKTDEIYLKLNEEYYTVKALKNQNKQNLQKELKCEVKSIENGEVELVQKKRKKVLPYILGLVVLIGAFLSWFFYTSDLKGFDEDLDIESKAIEISKPVVEEESFQMKINNFGGTTNSLKDKSKDVFQSFLTNTNKSEPETVMCYGIDTFEKFLSEKEQMNPIGIQFNKMESILTENDKMFITALVNASDSLNKAGVFQISGFACDLGKEKYNLELSKLRAEAVKDFIDSLDFNHKNVKVEYFGESKFKSTENIDLSRELNRVAIISYQLLE